MSVWNAMRGVVAVLVVLSALGPMSPSTALAQDETCRVYSGWFVGAVDVKDDCEPLDPPMRNPDYCSVTKLDGDLVANANYFEQTASGHWDNSEPDHWYYSGITVLVVVESDGTVSTLTGTDTGNWLISTEEYASVVGFTDGTGRFEGAEGTMRYHGAHGENSHETSSYLIHVCGPKL